MTSGHYCDGCAQAYYKCVCNKQEEKIIPRKMNERLNELAEQAGAFVSLTDEHYGKLILSGDDVIEKFAELLIQECAQVADIERDTSAGCGYVTYTDGQRIKKHFGVDV